MAYTDINSEDRLVQETFARHLERNLGWESLYAWNTEIFGPNGTLGRTDTCEVVLTRDLRAALQRLNPELPPAALDEAARTMTRTDFSRSLFQHNRDFYKTIRDGVPVEYRDANGVRREVKARVIDFCNGRTPDGTPNNRFLAVRELKLTGLRTPGYNRRADLVCFVNGLPLVFIELKSVYKNIRAGFDGNLRDYMDDNVIAHAFHHNAFLIVSNGHRARYGSITATWEHFNEWKRLDETEPGSVEAEVLLNGMLAHNRLLDIVENFILFDASKPGETRKIVARNHQYDGVNQAVASVQRQEALKRQYPPNSRYVIRDLVIPEAKAADPIPDPSPEDSKLYNAAVIAWKEDARSDQLLNYVEKAHPDLGRLGVFWHTQGSGKSYSMAFFAEKVRRTVSSKFTFLLMTDRNDLDGQLFGTFVGCGVASDKAPRAASGSELKQRLKENHRYLFSLIHKFNQDVSPSEPYSTRDDIIVISDEAHRTQSGKLARNMRLALPNASFIGFTGTPLFKNDHITRRIFGEYVSRYDFKRSEQDGSTTKLVYENRGEKLGIARMDLNDRIANAVAMAELDPDQEALLEKLLGKDYEVITADGRLDQLADDFVEHCATRWQSGKSMLVCIDRFTCARMHQRIMPRWQAKLTAVEAEIAAKEAALASCANPDQRETLTKGLEWARGQAQWLETTRIHIIISESQNEVADFKKWDFDIIPHRALIKQGFETPDGKRLDVETAFKDPGHPFRVAIVCAMWLTGFDVEWLSTLYVDKPMKAHTLMQAIARANRVYPGKDFGLIVDYNGILKSLREALAEYAIGDPNGDGESIIAPLAERILAMQSALDATEKHLRECGFEPADIIGAKGFDRIAAIANGAEAVNNARDEGRRRFEIHARVVFNRFKGLVAEPAAHVFTERHDNIEAIYKKLNERRDTADVSELLKELHRIVNQAIRTTQPGDDQMDAKRYDLSRIDLEKLRDEFARKAHHKATAIEDIRQIVEAKLALMLARNPRRMDYYKQYTGIIADYNHDKDRITIEETFARLMDLAAGLDAESRRAAEEGLNEAEYALFCLLQKDNISKTDRERVKLASRELFQSLSRLILKRERWTEKEQTRAEVETLILDELYLKLPSPPFNNEEKQTAAKEIFEMVWQQSAAGLFTAA